MQYCVWLLLGRSEGKGECVQGRQELKGRVRAGYRLGNDDIKKDVSQGSWRRGRIKVWGSSEGRTDERGDIS